MIFLYRVRDQLGRVKTGRFEAASRQAAAQRFQSKGWTVEELTPEVKKSGTSSSPPEAPRPGPAQRRRPQPKAQLPWKTIALCLVISGSLWGAMDWWQASHRPPAEIQEHRWRLRIQGQLPKDCQQIRLSFPELPLQLDRDRKQLDKSGQLKIDMELTSLREPTFGEAQLGEHKVSLQRASSADGPVFTLP